MLVATAFWFRFMVAFFAQQGPYLLYMYPDIDIRLVSVAAMVVWIYMGAGSFLIPKICSTQKSLNFIVLLPLKAVVYMFAGQYPFMLLLIFESISAPIYAALSCLSIILYAQTDSDLQRGHLSGIQKGVESISIALGAIISGTLSSVYMSSKTLQKALIGFPWLVALILSPAPIGMLIAAKRIYGHQEKSNFATA